MNILYEFWEIIKRKKCWIPICAVILTQNSNWSEAHGFETVNLSVFVILDA